MNMQIDHGSMIPKHKQLQDKIESLIKSGKWPEGFKLPSENILQKELEISRSTVRQALQAVENSGLIEKITGKGSFVKPVQSKSGNLIGIIASNLNREYHHKILLSIEEEARKGGFNIIFANSNGDYLEEQEILDQFISHNVKGIILWPAIQNIYHPEKLQKIQEEGTPIVILDRIIPGQSIDTVISDNYGGTYEATEFLIRNGHRKIVFISRPILSITSISDRLNGYSQAMTDNGLTPAAPFLVGEANSEMRTEDFPLLSGSKEYRAIETLLTKSKTSEAIVAMNDIMALNIIHIATEKGIRVPEELSVVGFDRLSIGSSYKIPLTTVFPNPERIGTEASRLLLKRITSGEKGSEIVRLPVELVIRDSARLSEN